MLITFRVTYQGVVPGAVHLTQGLWNNLVRAAWMTVGEYWATELRPKHFTREAYEEYQYEPRQGEAGREDRKSFWRSYTGRKQREFHHTLPLVLVGELRDRSADYRVEAVATRNRSYCRVVMPAAQKANLRHPNSPIDMRDELTRVSDREVQVLTALHDRRMQEQIDQTQDTSNYGGVIAYFHG